MHHHLLHYSYCIWSYDIFSITEINIVLLFHYLNHCLSNNTHGRDLSILTYCSSWHNGLLLSIDLWRFYLKPTNFPKWDLLPQQIVIQFNSVKTTLIGSTSIPWLRTSTPVEACSNGVMYSTFQYQKLISTSVPQNHNWLLNIGLR